MPTIEAWLSEHQLEKYIPAFVEAEVEVGDLVSLTEDDLKELGLPLGPRRRIGTAIEALKGEDRSVVSSPESAATVDAKPNLMPTDGALNAERRHLTVMFVDLVGSTEMSMRMDAEDMRDVITSYQNTVAGVVSRFDGFVAKFMGDGVLCYFGWPRERR